MSLTPSSPTPTPPAQTGADTLHPPLGDDKLLLDVDTGYYAGQDLNAKA